VDADNTDIKVNLSERLLSLTAENYTSSLTILEGPLQTHIKNTNELLSTMIETRTCSKPQPTCRWNWNYTVAAG
jgi:hypothetical protein